MMTLTTIAPKATSEQTAAVAEAEAVSTSYRHAYHEMPDRTAGQHVIEVDVLEQLKTNLAQLEDLHMRMKFMMGEIAYLLKRN